MHLRNVAVGDADRGPWRGPGTFGGERQFFGVDRCDDVFALLAADARGMRFHACDGDRPCCDTISLPVQRFGEGMAGQRRKFMIPGLRDEGLECLDLAVGHRRVAGIDRGTGRPQDAIEVGSEKGCAVSVGGVEGKEFLKQLPRLEERRVGVGRELGRVCLAKGFDRAEGGARRLDLEGIFRVGEAPLP